MTRVHGLRLWYAVVGSIVLWMVHLTAVASLAQFACNEGATWLINLTTVVLGLGTVLSMLLAWHLTRADTADHVSIGEHAASVAFLGRVGLLVGAADLLLILFEGILIVWISPCA